MIISHYWRNSRLDYQAKSSILSYVGRLELIKSTLTALHIYWASTYLLPKSILGAID